MKKETQKHLLAQIQENFKTFGAGQQFKGANMTALSLEDGPLVFAAGVDVADVVELVLRESGHQKLRDSCLFALGAYDALQVIGADKDLPGFESCLARLKEALKV